ncbi:Type 1 glutamine amidotransferase-like domain-containing protein [Halobacillus sp. B23F22_1]|uniref:Type 1 glutamine amidotransferase-like domain-containing protein n=1 Tax=Halobacillus sp. B23F22_1 TaxID=3459514 RepID=UPI00373DFC17
MRNRTELQTGVTERGKAGTLILSGGGNGEQSRIINVYFAELINKEKPVLYIPLAGDPHVRPYKESFEYVGQMFHEAGIKKVVMWTEVSLKTRQDLEAFSAIYISGGDSGRLLNIVKEDGFDEVLIDYFQNGGIIYGQSAGAIIFAKELTHLKNGHPVAGLNLIEGCSIWCHYTQKDDEAIHKRVTQLRHSVLLLPEGNAVLWNGSHMRSMGARSSFLINEWLEKEPVEELDDEALHSKSNSG